MKRPRIMTGAYPVPTSTTEVEDIVGRSRFITLLARASTPEEAKRFVGDAKARYPDASHHCWAFNAGPPSSTAHVGSSDDGEPHGTAGRPMLTTLLHSGVGEVVAVSVRYFGGVKLGTGGLSRAYAGGVRHALDECVTVDKVDRTTVVVTVGYEALEPVERRMAQLEAVVLERTFGADVRIRAGVPVASRTQLEADVADVTGGKGAVEDVTGP